MKQTKGVGMSDMFYLFTLHDDEKDFRISGAVIARSAQEASSLLGGEYVHCEGWPMGSASNRDDLSLYGKMKFAKELFRRFTPQELGVIAIDYDPGPLYSRTPGLHIWGRNGNGREFVIRRHLVTLPPERTL